MWFGGSRACYLRRSSSLLPNFQAHGSVPCVKPVEVGSVSVQAWAVETAGAPWQASFLRSPLAKPGRPMWARTPGGGGGTVETTW